MVADSRPGIGAVIFLFGEFLHLWQKKRIFDRTNKYGVAQFYGSWRKLAVKANDKPMFGMAITLFFRGLLTLASAYEATWGWIAILPLYLFIIFLVVGA